MQQKMFSIFADYRPADKVTKHYYYIIARNKTEAKKNFQNTIPWLKVYEVEECNDDITQTVIDNPESFILL